MSKQIERLEDLVKKLPPDRQNEVRDFVEFLLARGQTETGGKPGFHWAGALKDLEHRYTSVELQHQIARWRAEDE